MTLVKAYIALGSNLGDREGYLARALAALRESPGVTVCRVSSTRETAPVGGPPGQQPYLNAVAELETELEPEQLLHLLLDVERRLDRVRGERWGPRTIDLDLLLHGSLIRETRDLTLPHPRLHEREFVLRPLAELAPNLIHPELGRTIRELLGELEQARPASVETSRAAPRSAGDAVRELRGQRALVTGSTSGIGRAIALELARAGADVLVHGRRSQLAAEDVAGRAAELGVRTATLMADLRNEAELPRLIERAWGTWGGLEIWVNNAGADTLTGEASRWPFERKLRELLAVDVTATLLLSRAIGERMRPAGGVIINIGWDQAETGMEGDSGQLFAATKAAVMAFTRSLALTLAPSVRVNCVAPGWIKTAWGESASPAWQERVHRETPLKRWGTPEDVAAAVCWLASPASAFVTGQIIRVNGGAVR